MSLPTLKSEDYALNFANLQEALKNNMKQEQQEEFAKIEPSRPIQATLPLRNHPNHPIEAPLVSFTRQLPKNAADATPGTYLFTTFDIFEIEEWVKDFCRYHEGWKWGWKCSVAWMVLRLCDEDVAEEGEVLVVIGEDNLEMRFREECLVVAEKLCIRRMMHSL